MSDPMTWAAKDAPTFDPYEHAVLTVLTQAGDHEDGANCGISYATLAQRAKMCDKEAQSNVHALRDRGLIGFGDQAAVAHIRADRRPVVYDVLIPYDWYSPTQLTRVNRWREDRGRPPLSPDPCGPECARTKTATGPRCGHRPPLAAAPPKRRRSDYGTKRVRPADGGTVSPVVHGGTNSPAGLVNRHGGTSSSVDGDLSQQVMAGEPVHGGTSSPTTSFDLLDLTSLSNADRGQTEERERSDSKTDTTVLVDELVDETLARHPTWGPRLIRRAIQDELNDGRPADLVAAAWRACIADAKTTTPARFRHPGSWWDAAYGSAAKAARHTKPPWCGTCDRDTRQRLDAEERPHRCPTCHPLSAGAVA